MFIDNCSAHGKIEAMEQLLKAITLVYFPPNTTSHLQPLDQGIIHSLKSHYRARMIRKFMAHLEGEGVMNPPNILEAIQMISASWHLDVTESTIANCFRKAGLTKDTSNEGGDVPASIDNLALSEAVSDFINVVGVQSDFLQSDFETIDDDVECIEPLHADDQSIIDSVNDKNTEEEQDEEDDEAPETEPPSASEALVLVDKLRTFFLNEPETDMDRFVELDRIESEINRSRLQNLRQSSITDFFTR